MARSIVQTGTKRVVRDISLKGVRSDKAPPVASKRAVALRDPTLCEKCGAVFTRKMWRKPERVSFVRVGSADWVTCPACDQVAHGAYFGRVVLKGAWVAAHAAELTSRIENVAKRAGHTQPERRLVSLEPTALGLEVLTTSQKLAHRIAAELHKAFRGKVSYHWADRDGSLYATWERNR